MHNTQFDIFIWRILRLEGRVALTPLYPNKNQDTLPPDLNAQNKATGLHCEGCIETVP